MAALAVNIPVQPLLTAALITDLHDSAVAAWHRNEEPTLPSHDHLLSLALHQHRANHDLWHEEDGARDPRASDHSIAEIKHHIDSLNQRRNDLVERIDEFLLSAAGSQPGSAPLHSETPGLIIDRLSILALKIYHTAEESRRLAAGPGHCVRCAERLAILEAQRADLADCLEHLWADVLGGRRRFKLYRQMKMYNDPDLNPVLYRAPRS